MIGNIKNNIKILFGIIIGILVSSITTYALSVGANHITYDNSKSGIAATNVADAIDELYAKAKTSTDCLEGYAKINTTSQDYKCSKTYTVSFDPNGGTGGQSSEVTAIYGAAMPTITTTRPTKSGYTFLGWYDAKTGGTQYYTYSGASSRNYDKTTNTVLYAHWGDLLSDKAKLGDYISLTPTTSSYTTDTEKTGYSSTQTINPQELNRWRVLSINSDGTVDVVSRYTSSVAIYFKGVKGYANYSGYLNTLAKQYENSTYTAGSRNIGYNGQIGTLTNTSKFDDTTCTNSSTVGEKHLTSISQGASDSYYTKDYNQLSTALGTQIAYRVDATSTAAEYWLSSRHYGWMHDRGTYNRYWFSGYRVSSSGSVTSGTDTYNGANSNIRYHKYSCNWVDSAYAAYIRPVLTIKSSISISGGSGTASSPYTLCT